MVDSASKGYVKSLAKDDKAVENSIIRSEYIAESNVSGKFPPFDTSTFVSQFFWLVVIFAIFHWIVHRFVLPRIDLVIKLRRNQILHDCDEVNNIKKQIDSLVASYENELDAARKNAQAMIDKAVDSSIKKINFATKEAEIDYLQKLSDSQKKINDMQEEALKEISSASCVVVKELVRRMVGTSVSNDKLQSMAKTIQ
ncbi:MAG: hypothetical protein C4617_05130 [Candidatus Liberibacter europaeus]|uniref:ATP synthase subunit b n=1 Tax=Candidatus Liberibacter europaeus TaxID=744859 RepID=A0A2T4VWN1_9HYPH|nr:hypothetical protein [Candidatus Liberibacter europaeus]PTL86150.1 MAG: hypothetical protein C4617_05130 [Candidatus Liberibacter europaeus]